MSKSQPLGKGLSALIQKKPEGAEAAASAPGEAFEQVLQLPLETIGRNRNQPRREFDAEELAELAASIRENGVLQPVLVFEDGGLYTLIAGERRWRAAREAGLKAIPAIVRPRVDGRELMKLALIENIQREDLNPLDLASGYRALIEDYGMTQEELARGLGLSRSAVANVLRLIKLPTVIKVSLKEGKISFGHAKVLLGLTSDDERIRCWQLCVKRALSVRQLEELVQGLRAEGSERPAVVKPFDILQAEESLASALGAKVLISPNRSRGQIRIDYRSKDELDRLLELLATVEDQ
jgi:ParB family transcriptional regulator, chromosome partitioning protein